jgi:hypothetical protein
MDTQSLLNPLNRVSDIIANLMSNQQIQRYADIKDNIVDLAEEVYDHTHQAAELVVAIIEDVLTKDNPAATRTIRNIDPELFAQVQAALKEGLKE